MEKINKERRRNGAHLPQADLERRLLCKPNSRHGQLLTHQHLATVYYNLSVNSHKTATKPTHYTIRLMYDIMFDQVNSLFKRGKLQCQMCSWSSCGGWCYCRVFPLFIEIDDVYWTSIDRQVSLSALSMNTVCSMNMNINIFLHVFLWWQSGIFSSNHSSRRYLCWLSINF